MKITKRMEKELSRKVNEHNAFIKKYYNAEKGKSEKPDCNFIGDCCDIVVNRPKSKNNGKSGDNTPDCYIAVLKKNGKKIYIASECKVNEGHNFTSDCVKNNYYIILVKCDNSILYEYITLEKLIEFLNTLEFKYTVFNEFFNTSYCTIHADKKSDIVKYRILYKSKKYDSYLNSLPDYFNDIVID